MANDKRARAKHEPSFNKIPRAGALEQPEKLPKLAAEPRSIMDMQPAWRLSNMRMKSPFGWGAITRGDMQQVIERFKALESMTWSAILVEAKKHNHHCDVGGMCKEAQKCLEDDWQGGADEVLTIRLTNKKRVWGVLEGPLVYLLWWDPEHSVYPSLKKHT
jgi:hypothetical protein